MPRHLKVLLILGAITDARWTWKHRERFKHEWNRAGW